MARHRSHSEGSSVAEAVLVLSQRVPNRRVGLKGGPMSERAGIDPPVQHLVDTETGAVTPRGIAIAGQLSS